MNNVADVDLEQLWASTPPQARQRIAGLARRIFKATAAAIHIPGTGQEIARQDLAQCESSAGDASQPDAVLSVPIELGGRAIGELRVDAPAPRAWTEEERAILVDLAAQLADHVELCAWRRSETGQPPGEVHARLLAVADRIPGLIFQRRKLDAGRSAYTFFGSGKTGLPAVRQMMEGGIAGLSFVHRDDRDAVRAAILGSNVEETDLDLTFRIKDFERRIRWVRSQSIVRREADGTVCWDGMCFDITDLVAAREASEAGRTSNAALLLKITRELQDPLRAMIGLSQLMQAEDRGLSAHAGTIRVAAESMLACLEQALAPAAVPAPSKAALHDVVDTVSGQTGARILLADDLDLNRKLISDMLSFEGHVVDCVADGAEAVQAVGRRPYDLILMDMIMPNMDGVAATKAIRALPKPACNVPIVALTANSERDQLDGCIEAGMDATLTKPMSMDALTAAVAQWTRGRKAA